MPATAPSLPRNASRSSMSQPPAQLLEANLGMDSTALLQGRKSVTIVHNGMPYRLQATKLGKLILTK